MPSASHDAASSASDYVPPRRIAADKSATARSARMARSAALVRMEGHPPRNRLHRIERAVERHQQEEQEVNDGKHPRERDVQAFRRLQSEVAERDERHREQ